MVAAVGKTRGGQGFVAAVAGVVMLSSCRQIVGIGPPADEGATCRNVLMIDNLEDGDREICAVGGREGVWLTLGDGTSTDLQPAQGSTFTPTLIPGGRGQSRHAARFSGSGFTDWGAKMIFDLDDSGGLATVPYNASTTAGLTFWMKSTTAVTLSFTLPETVPAARGGMCMDSSTAWNCENNYQFRIAQPTTNDWLQYWVPYAALAQGFLESPRHPIFGSATWNPSRLLGAQFSVDPGATFDVWIDDVAFYHCQTTACVPTCGGAAPKPCPAQGLSPAACWPAGTDCSSIPLCLDPGTPIGCPSTADSPAACGRIGTDCSAVRYFDVAGTSPNDVWAVGVRGMIVHWDGVTWSRVASGTTEDLVDVWASAEGGLWAVGLGGTILRWTSAGWTASSSGTTQHLGQLWANDPSDAWVIGVLGTLLHWDGSVWSPKDSGSTQDLLGIWGSGPGDVWAVGMGGTMLHWNGAVWSSLASGTTETLIGLWGTASDDVWAVGFNGTILHWNGTAWSKVVSGTGEILADLWGSGPDDVWAVGRTGTLLHWDGASWSSQSVDTTQILDGVWGSRSDDVWVVGGAGTILHWNGSAWSDQPLRVGAP